MGNRREKIWTDEIWGWREYEEIERVQKKYLKWTLGLEKYTPGHIVREETKRQQMREEACKRAVGIEKSLVREVIVKYCKNVEKK